MEVEHNIESILGDNTGNAAATKSSLYQTLKSGAKKATGSRQKTEAMYKRKVNRAK